MHVPGEDAVRDLPTGCTTNSHIESSAVLVVVSYRLVGRGRIRINLAHVPGKDIPWIYQAVVVVVVAPKFSHSKQQHSSCWCCIILFG